MTERSQIRAFTLTNLSDASCMSSVLLEAEGVSIICRIKAEVTKDPLLSSRRNLKARVTVSGEENATNEIINRLENVLSQLIPPDSIEKLQLQVGFEILSLDGSLIDYCLNLAIYCLMLGNVPLRDTVASCTCVVSQEGKLIADPTREELSLAKGKVRIAASSQRDKISDFELVGEISENDHLKDSLGLALSGAKAVMNNIIQRIVAREQGEN